MAGETILVVDDDPVIQKLLQLSFSMEGYEVVVAADGVEALERAAQRVPDLVVLDVMMPRMDGLQAAAALRADPRTKAVPIIMLSAKAQEVDQRAGREAGVDLYVTKPFDPLELLETAVGLMSGPG